MMLARLGAVVTILATTGSAHARAAQLDALRLQAAESVAQKCRELAPAAFAGQAKGRIFVQQRGKRYLVVIGSHRDPSLVVNERGETFLYNYREGTFEATPPARLLDREPFEHALIKPKPTHLLRGLERLASQAGRPADFSALELLRETMNPATPPPSRETRRARAYSAHERAEARVQKLFASLGLDPTDIDRGKVHVPERQHGGGRPGIESTRLVHRKLRDREVQAGMSDRFTFTDYLDLLVTTDGRLYKQGFEDSFGYGYRGERTFLTPAQAQREFPEADVAVLVKAAFAVTPYVAPAKKKRTPGRPVPSRW
ncbi:MAG: hypothetical protein IT371_31170 [Deltaproteobacteria bacterium]|nr:hypothetical protein [Deltaproteobacteria bacterium]